MQIRRIVTGHDASGKAVVKTDEQITAVPRIAGGISGCEIWSTDRMPIDNSAAADPLQRAGFVKQYNYVGDGVGTTFRINEFAPGNARFTHHTETMDYVLQLTGEIDCELESGKVVHLKPGDVMVQRGTIHTWVNKGSVPAVTAFILIDATPEVVNGKEMRTVYPLPREAMLSDRNRLPASKNCTHAPGNSNDIRKHATS
jgi:quercetin dioxygenase-like cupin family protein